MQNGGGPALLEVGLVDPPESSKKQFVRVALEIRGQRGRRHVVEPAGRFFHGSLAGPEASQLENRQAKRGRIEVTGMKDEVFSSTGIGVRERAVRRRS